MGCELRTVAFKWIDTKDVRAPDSRAYAILNDQEQRVSQAVTDALQNYEVKAVLGSGREQVKEELVA